MATKGAILKQRIRQCGYTQEQFADAIGIGLSSLKKYLNDTNKYDYDLLLKFSEKLDCSLDYLMGLTETPHREMQTVKDKTGLSDEAIEIMQTLYEGKKQNANLVMIKTLDTIICNQDLLSLLLLYFYANEIDEIESIFEMMISQIKSTCPDLDIKTNGTILAGIIEQLALCKAEIESSR